MISLREYMCEQLITNNINNNEKPVNEMLLTCLVALAMANLGIKGIKGIGNCAAACWNAVLGNTLKNIDNFNDSLIDSTNIISEEKISVKSNDIFVLQIPDKKTLTAVIKTTKPKKGLTTDSGHGLWSLYEKIKENNDLLEVDNGQLKPQYAALITKKDKKIVGAFGFSTNFWDAAKSAADKKIAKEYKKYIHIIDIDICPEYKIDNIDEFVWKTIFDMQKELKTKGITIWYDDDTEKQEYKNKGFNTVKNHQHIMYCDNKDYKEDE